MHKHPTNFLTTLLHIHHVAATLSLKYHITSMLHEYFNLLTCFMCRICLRTPAKNLYENTWKIILYILEFINPLNIFLIFTRNPCLLCSRSFVFFLCLYPPVAVSAFLCLCYIVLPSKSVEMRIETGINAQEKSVFVNKARLWP